jgi:hypothetical protein
MPRVEASLPGVAREQLLAQFAPGRKPDPAAPFDRHRYTGAHIAANALLADQGDKRSKARKFDLMALLQLAGDQPKHLLDHVAGISLTQAQPIAQHPNEPRFGERGEIQVVKESGHGEGVSVGGVKKEEALKAGALGRNEVIARKGASPRPSWGLAPGETNAPAPTAAAQPLCISSEKVPPTRADGAIEAAHFGTSGAMSGGPVPVTACTHETPLRPPWSASGHRDPLQRWQLETAMLRTARMRANLGTHTSSQPYAAKREHAAAPATAPLKPEP